MHTFDNTAMSQRIKGGKDHVAKAHDRKLRGSTRSSKPTKVWNCLICKDILEDEQSVASCVQCYICEGWAHKGCGKLTDSEFSTLSNDKSACCSNMQWVCDPCVLQKEKGKKKKKSYAQAAKQESNPNLEALFATMMKTFSDRIDKMEEKLTGKHLEEKIEAVVDRVVDKKIDQAVYEKIEKEKRKNNIIIVNLKESTKKSEEGREKDDTKSVKTLLSKMVKIKDGDLKEAPVRLGDKGSKPRVLKVVLKNETLKREVLKKAPSLNVDVPFEKRVYINQDYTKRQRENHKKLREELKQRLKNGETNLGIRGEEIVKIPPRSDKVEKGIGRRDESEDEDDEDDDEEEDDDSDEESVASDEEEADDEEELVDATTLFD